MENKVKEKVFTWLYRTFTYIVPSGIMLWSFVIEKLFKKDVSLMAKLGVSGTFVLVVMVIIGAFFYNKRLVKKITDITNQCIECVDNEEKSKLVEKKKKLEMKLDIFHNLCFIVPFIVVWAILCFVENGVVSLRGTMLVICSSMAVGFGFNVIAGLLKAKGVNNNEDKGTNTREDQ